jgi:hypothetical protein
MTESDQDYWRREGLDRLVELYEDAGRDDPYHATAGKATVAFAPQAADLVRLHRLIRERMATTVLEFGVGFSTVVMADALAKNEADFAALPDRPKIRNTKAFQLFAVDASQHWITETRKRIPGALSDRVHFSHSRVVAGTHNGQLCHFYEALPNVIADFIYLDGPSPKDVEGSINGLDFSIDERTVMSGDLLLMESTMLPRTFIIVDGRVNNARFLQRNFTRNFVHRHDPAADVTTFELDEPPLGRHSHDLAALIKAQRRR